LAGSLRADASHELVYGIAQRTQTALCVDPCFGELAESFVCVGPQLANTSIGFFAVPSERHRYIHQLANHLPVGLNKPLRLRLPLLEQLNVHGEFSLLLNDEVHP
jgi:hypothetical protein